MNRFYRLLMILGVGVAFGGLPTVAIAQEDVTISGESLNVESRSVQDFQSVWLEPVEVRTLEADTNAAFIDPTGVRVNLNNQVEYILREGANNTNVAFPFTGNQPIGNEGQVQFKLGE